MLCLIVTVATVATLVLGPAPQEPLHFSSADKRSFETAKTEAGNDPAKLVKLALWCEQHGMRRTAHRVGQGRDARPEECDGSRVIGPGLIPGPLGKPRGRHQADERRRSARRSGAEYNALRDRVDRDTEIERRTVDNFERSGFYAKAAEVKLRLDRRLATEHLRLGAWCEKQGMKPEALAHFTTAVYLNPHDAAAWHHLGYVKHHGRWMNHEQIAAQERETLAQMHADRHWEPLFRKWANELKSRSRRADAEARLAEVSDPRAVPSITRLFAAGLPAYQTLAVQLLCQIDVPAATRELATIAVYSDSAEVAIPRRRRSKDAVHAIMRASWLIGSIRRFSSRSSPSPGWAHKALWSSTRLGSISFGRTKPRCRSGSHPHSAVTRAMIPMDCRLS